MLNNNDTSRAASYHIRNCIVIKCVVIKEKAKSFKIVSHEILTQRKSFGVGASITIQRYEASLSKQQIEVLRKHDRVDFSMTSFNYFP